MNRGLLLKNKVSRLDGEEGAHSRMNVEGKEAGLFP